MIHFVTPYGLIDKRGHHEKRVAPVPARRHPLVKILIGPDQNFSFKRAWDFNMSP
jgi:hypothetical protein